MVRYALVLHVLTLAVACGGSSPPTPTVRPRPAPAPDGRRELEASRQAMSKVSRFTIALKTDTEMGTSRTVHEVDCANPYYHKTEVADLTPRGVEAGTTASEGRPRAHRDSESLFVNGLSYTRSTLLWETAPRGTDTVGWKLSPDSFADYASCDVIRAQPDLMGVPFSKMATAGTVAFLGLQDVGAARCNEFRFIYEDTVEARVCIGAADKLVYRAEHTEMGLPSAPTFSYGEFARLPAPMLKR
jgi:hypothetical protein